MTEPLKVYIGYDARDHDAFQVCERSLKEHASIPVRVIALKEWELRQSGVYWRSYRVDPEGQRWDDRDGKPFSTDFSFTRFCVPALENYDGGWVLFCDPDMLWRADVAELLARADDAKAVMCVKHDHRPEESQKGVGKQTIYHRKNWSSLMLLNVWRCRNLTPYAVNNLSGSQLHAMTWIDDDQIGALPEEWNWLEGWSDPGIEPKVVHHTRGTPDMPGYEGVAYADEWRAVLEGRAKPRGKVAA